MSEILSQGAEAIIEKEGDKVYKKRISKSYRHEKLDISLRRSRTKRERKVMNKLLDLDVAVPKVYEDKQIDETVIIMDFIDGQRLRDVLLEDPTKTNYLRQLGSWMAKMHEESIMHGDLTTSNAIVDKTGKMYLIDFGLSFFSQKIEDMAVDVHLFEQAVESTHYKHAKEFFKEFLKSYKTFEKYDEVMTRLNKVRARGKNKQ